MYCNRNLILSFTPYAYSEGIAQSARVEEL